MLQVRDRFPDLDSLVESKLLLPHEAERLQRVDFTTPHEATWTPILWALKLVCKARSVLRRERLSLSIDFVFQRAGRSYPGAPSLCRFSEEF